MFQFKKTDIDGLQIITPHVFSDERGVYKKIYEKEEFISHGITAVFTECSDLFSHKGALRGLHYQTVDSQAKLVRVVSGIVFDVALDLRENSLTFGKFHCELLDSSEYKAIFIPEGFAHGFLALSENVYFSYQSSGHYNPESCGGIRWNDPALAIPWPLKEFDISTIIATEKDKTWPTFQEYESKQRK